MDIGAVLTKEQINRLSSRRVLTQALGAIGLLLEQQLGMIRIEISRREVLGQGGLDQFLFAVLAGALGLEIGTKATDADHTRQAIQLDGARCDGIDVTLTLGHLLLQTLLTAEKGVEIRQPLGGAIGDFIEGSLHPRREAGIHQIREVLLQQSGDGKGRETRRKGVVLQRGVTAIADGADDRGVGGGPTDAFFLQHLHQGGFAKASWWLGLVAEGFTALADGVIATAQGWQQDLLAFQSGIRVIAALHIGAEETSEINPFA